MAIPTWKIDRWFGKQGVTAEENPKVDEIRTAARNLADVIIKNTPTCGDQSHALRCVRDAMNTAIESLRCKVDDRL